MGWSSWSKGATKDSARASSTYRYLQQGATCRCVFVCSMCLVCRYVRKCKGLGFMVSGATAFASACIRQHTSAYVSIQKHTSAYVSKRQHTLAVGGTEALPTLTHTHAQAYGL